MVLVATRSDSEAVFPIFFVSHADWIRDSSLYADLLHQVESSALGGSFKFFAFQSGSWISEFQTRGKRAKGLQD